jgi:lipoprotein NlpI
MKNALEKVTIPWRTRRAIWCFLALVLGISLPLTLAAEKNEPSARELVRSGMEHFRAGRIKASIADFELAVKKQPNIGPQLWQLGISYYYAGEFAKGRKLFESHQTVNSQDVENAVWHFLCLAKLEGVEAARKKFIAITADRRVPMKEIHGLFSGKATKEDVLKAARAGNPGEAELKNRLCYAHLYVGLYEEAIGQAEESLRSMQRAAGEFAQNHYMGDVAKVHVKERTKP